MSEEMRTLETTIAGVINGTPFKCSGVGHSPLNSGQSRATLSFDTWPGLSPLVYNRTWKCGNHKSLAISKNNDPNPFAQMLGDGATIHRIDEQEYPKYKGKILACSQVYWREPLVQVFESGRVGRYDGPDDIVCVLPHEETITPQGAGKAVGLSSRQMLTGAGELIDIDCRTTYTYPDKYTLPSALVIRYEGNMVWKEEELTLTIETQATFKWVD